MSADTTGGACRFPRSARLLSPGEFQNVFSLGRRLNGPLFRLHARLSALAAVDGVSVETTSELAATISTPAVISTSRVRLGISVPKRVAALAVERNRIRRIVREDFRCLRGRLPPGDYVLVAQREAKDAAGSALRDALASLWRRAGALKPEGAAPTMPIPEHRPAPADSDTPPLPVAPPDGARSRPAPAETRPATRGVQDDSDR